MEKLCPQCGNHLRQEDVFCDRCGTKYAPPQVQVAPTQAQQCPRCGTALPAGSHFCPQCGAALQGQPGQPGENLQEYLKKGLDSFTSTINSMAGEEGAVEIRIRELFSEVFKKHTLQEREELFACGTSKTTPKESEMITEWPKPWLYSRILLMFAVVFAGLHIMITQFNNSNAMPGAMFIGALIVPFSFVVFFWEVNVPRNISIFDVVSVFFVGGVFSLVATLMISSVIGSGELDYIGAILVGIAEETGKIVVAAYYIRKNSVKYKLNGLLLGACVGAGFAVFETAGYAFRFYLRTGSIQTMMHVLFIRAVLAVGGHVVWTAIAGFALVAAKGDEPLSREHFQKPAFVRFFVYVIALHAVWDMPITLGSQYYLVPWCLTAMALVTVLVLINSGLKQVAHIAQAARAQEQ